MIFALDQLTTRLGMQHCRPSVSQMLLCPRAYFLRSPGDDDETEIQSKDGDKSAKVKGDSLDDSSLQYRREKGLAQYLSLNGSKGKQPSLVPTHWIRTIDHVARTRRELEASRLFPKMGVSSPN
jgi:hypothetical protein